MLAVALLDVARLDAQTVTLTGHGVLVADRVDRTPNGASRTEIRVIHPMLGATIATGSHLRLIATANLEGLTLRNGELSLGSWGEGFVDRRHPHTFVQELIVDGRIDARCGPWSCRFGGYVGKGFVPFGSEDPMARDPIRFPINHHLAQILERAVLGAQARIGPVTLEAAVFNGDEPERPLQWPNLSRFGDSWAGRVTLGPWEGVELSASRANVASPEHRPGAGAVQRKSHVGLRWDRSVGSSRITGLAEWARTSELDDFFVFGSRLGELGWQRERLGLHYRFEATDRPEEERLTPFRSARPHLENSILGITRWTVHTLGSSLRLGRHAAGLDARALLEVSRGRIGDRSVGVFDLRSTYKGDAFWSLSAAIAVSWGTGHRHSDRDPIMGRYGISRR